MNTEQKRSLAIKTGKKFATIVCPLCLRARVGSVWRNGHIFKIDDNAEVLQTRYNLGGKGQGGFFKNEAESVRMADLRKGHPDIWKDIKASVNKLNNILGEVGE
ncbi:MAG: hypothetical protein ABH851_07510 [Methanobacteriota archaeon]